MNRDAILEVKHLSKSFGANAVLKDIDFVVHPGDVTSIIGSSGSGKSTLLRCINLLETPTSGDVVFHGDSVVDKKVNAAAYRAKVGMVFQSFNLFNNMSVLENCIIGQTKVLKRNKEEAKEKAMQYLTKVGMNPYINAKPRQLSGGQKQRVAIAGIIAMKPDCILLDEPTAMLDPHGRDEVMKTVKMLNEQGVTIVLITHYMEEAAQAQRVVVIDGGEVIMDNVPKKIFSNVETMKNLGLDVPQVTELCWELKKAGYDISTEIIHEDECVQKLYEMLK